jgi:hypothetical protein
MNNEYGEKKQTGGIIVLHDRALVDELECIAGEMSELCDGGSNRAEGSIGSGEIEGESGDMRGGRKKGKQENTFLNSISDEPL